MFFFFPIIGFKPEILRHCEHALRELPMEDPRLKMKGRFFFDPYKDDTQIELQEYSSNSILLQQGKNKIAWTEEEEQHSSSTKTFVQTHQKICQTDELETENKFVQASVIMMNAEVQVNIIDVRVIPKEEKKPIVERLDWNSRETFDYTSKYSESDDLKWGPSQKSSRWNRSSPPRKLDDLERERRATLELHGTSGLELHRSRDPYASHRTVTIGENWSPTYNPRSGIGEHDRRMDEFHEIHEIRSNHSLGESPMVIDDSDDDIDTEVYPKGLSSTDWHSRGKSTKERLSPMEKSLGTRGKLLNNKPQGRGGCFRPNY